MPETFESVWRVVRAEAPVVPPLLLRQWAQDGYSKLCDGEWGWSFLRAEGTIVTQAARTVTVTVVQGSATVTSVGQFLVTDAGRQIRPIAGGASGRLPIYTIISVTDPSTVLLDRAYTEPSATGDVTIQDIYTVMPADFRRFLVIYDRYYLRIIPFWMSEDEIAVVDPGRMFSDQGPRYLVANRYSTATATLGQVRYEYWPAPVAVRSYPYLYIRRPEQLLDSSVLPGVLSERADLLRTYVRAQAAGWPGTSDARNPYFNLDLKAQLVADWNLEKGKLENADDNEYPQQLMLIHWERRVGSIAPTASLLRQTDATINDYY